MRLLFERRGAWGMAERRMRCGNHDEAPLPLAPLRKNIATSLKMGVSQAMKTFTESPLWLPAAVAEYVPTTTGSVATPGSSSLRGIALDTTSFESLRSNSRISNMKGSDNTSFAWPSGHLSIFYKSEIRVLLTNHHHHMHRHQFWSGVLAVSCYWTLPLPIIG